MSKTNLTINNEFSRLISQYQALVFTIIYGITLKSDESGDLTQEVFVKAFNCSDFTGKNFNQKAWLIKVARNEALNRWH